MTRDGKALFSITKNMHFFMAFLNKVMVSIQIENVLKKALQNRHEIIYFHAHSKLGKRIITRAHDQSIARSKQLWQLLLPRFSSAQCQAFIDAPSLYSSAEFPIYHYKNKRDLSLFLAAGRS